MKQRVLFLTSHPMCVVSFMMPHIRALKKIFEIQVLANTNERNLLFDHGIDVAIQSVDISRQIALWADIKTLWFLYWHFMRNDLSAVHTITPKAGLLGMAAAWMARVPLRIHSFTGQVWVTHRGPMRWILIAADKCIAAMATEVLVDSHSQRDFLIAKNIISLDKSSVLGAGSICGVDTKRFNPCLSIRKVVRSELNTSQNSLVCLYLGRLNKDKGVFDLALAFSEVARVHPSVELWVVGPDENNCFQRMQILFGNYSHRVKRVGFTKEPERYMQAADLFCMPSYREGFGSSVIEAAACGIPALVSRIYGLSDAVLEGQTGWMHEAGNTEDLTHQLNEILSFPTVLVEKGKKAKRYAESMFLESAVTGAMTELYIKRLQGKI
jgi:glycosyltransferase involved in cell wall biosynthesis